MSPSGQATVEPSAGARVVVVERPPAGLARGEYAWPPWAIATAGTVLFVLGAALWLLLLRRKRGR